jgi:methylenetetrahydrofolate reductase (NADPH)
MARRGLEPASRPALAALLRAPTFEVLPLASTLDLVEHLPEGGTVSVAASPRRGLEATLDVAARLETAGFRAVPHIAARMVRDESHLRQLLDGVTAAGIDRAFVVGGDAVDSGAYPSGLALLRAMAELDSPLNEIGIPGYPEGHPFIPHDELRAALLAKAPYASYLTTQLCFNPGAVVDWIGRLRTDGIGLPVHVGIAGAVDVPRLIAISTRIGVTTAARFALRHGRLVSRLLRLRGYRPDGLLEALVAQLPADLAGVDGLHIYTFNQVAATARWRRSYIGRLEPADRAAV